MTLYKMLAVAGVLTLAIHTTAQAELEQALIDDGWDEITFEGSTENVFTARDDISGLSREIQLNAQSSVSIAFLNIDIDLMKTPTLNWSWRSDTPIIDTDITKKGGDDRTLVLYVAFPYQPDQASFGYRFRRAAIELMRGADTPDRILTYTWGGGGPRGSKVPNPYTGENGQIILKRTPEDEVGVWLNENVNLRQDFIDAFGFEPVSPVFIGIGGDSDDTNSLIEARVRGLRFME